MDERLNKICDCLQKKLTSLDWSVKNTNNEDTKARLNGEHHGIMDAFNMLMKDEVILSDIIRQLEVKAQNISNNPVNGPLQKIFFDGVEIGIGDAIRVIQCEGGI
ncbi:MAG: hypothetical protein ACRC76_10015 [Proteocatella sp.]